MASKVYDMPKSEPVTEDKVVLQSQDEALKRLEAAKAEYVKR